MCMATTAELHAVAELHYAHFVAVLLAEEGNGAQFFGLFDRDFTVLLKRDVLAYLVVDDAFHLTQFLIGYFLEVREVETEVVGGYQRTSLFNMFAQYGAEGLVEQVRTSVVGFTGSAQFPYPHMP